MSAETDNARNRSLKRMDGRRCAGEAHDYEAAVKKARATWVCPKCGHDVSWGYVLWWEAVHSAPSPIDPKLSDGEAWRGSCVAERSEGIRAREKGGSDETGPS